MKYNLIRSKRKTISLIVDEKGLTVRAPMRAGKAEIEDVIMQNMKWIETRLRKAEEMKEKLKEAEPLGEEELKALVDQAMKIIPERVRFYAPKIGVRYGRITIRKQRTKWGSCSNKGNLNFNCLLMLTPPEVIDSIVVHELCHLKEMNHSKKFYDEVLRVMPDYPKWQKWLKDNGGLIMMRMRL